MFRRLGAFFLDILEVIVFAVGIFFFVYLLIMRPHKIKGASMSPNYPDSEYLLTEKVTYYLRQPERGDIVVLVPPPAAENEENVSCGYAPPAGSTPLDEFIKRIVALPGETVRIQGSNVYINGRLLDEPYLHGVETPPGTFLCEGEEFTVPQGEYMVFGDNRPNSSDSRYWGPIKKSEITGRAWIIYWPVNHAGVVPAPVYTFEQ